MVVERVCRSAGLPVIAALRRRDSLGRSGSGLHCGRSRWTRRSLGSWSVNGQFAAGRHGGWRRLGRCRRRDRGPAVDRRWSSAQPGQRGQQAPEPASGGVTLGVVAQAQVPRIVVALGDLGAGRAGRSHGPAEARGAIPRGLVGCRRGASSRGRPRLPARDFSRIELALAGANARRVLARAGRGPQRALQVRRRRRRFRVRNRLPRPGAARSGDLFADPCWPNSCLSSSRFRSPSSRSAATRDRLGERLARRDQASPPRTAARDAALSSSTTCGHGPMRHGWTGRSSPSYFTTTCVNLVYPLWITRGRGRINPHTRSAGRSVLAVAGRPQASHSIWRASVLAAR